jgi:serine/threonine-protein kinase HipA
VEANLQKFNSPHHTFLSKRFDRTENGKRIHFASAMTMLKRSDGDDASKGKRNDWNSNIVGADSYERIK